MKDAELIATLKKRVEKDRVLADVMELFKSRERARSTVVWKALCNAMSAAKYKHPYTEYARVLETLGDLGLGRVEKERGKIKALHDININLQSLANAVMGRAAVIERYQARNSYREPDLDSRPASPQGHSMVLTFMFKGKGINLPIPHGLSAQDTAELIAKLQSEEADAEK